MNRIILLAGMTAVVSGCNCGGPLGTNDAAKACITLQSCFPKEWQNGTFGGSLTSCTSDFGLSIPLPGSVQDNPPFATGLEKPMRAVYSCLAGAGGNCTQAAQCFALNGGGGACSQPTGLGGGQCTGTVLTGCTADSITFNVDCAKYGTQCSRSGAFFFSFNACTFGPCSDPSQTRCEGSVAEVCAASIQHEDCGQLGRSCGSLPDGGPGVACINGRSCAPNSPDTCEGTVAVTCQSDSQELRLDCASQPVSRQCQKGTCVLTGNECDATLGTTCDGTKIKFCQDGFIKEYDCIGLGFSNCANDQCVPK